MRPLTDTPAPHAEGSTLFRLRNLHHRYPDGTPALTGVDLDISPGERLVLLGPNGAGKTTLAKHLNGLLIPDSGEITYRDQPLAGPHLAQARMEIGLLFQDPDDQLFCNSVREDILFGPYNQQLDPAVAEAAADAALRAADLSDQGDRPPHTLSYGQRKRAALASLLVMQPDVLVLDEPTAHLDPYQEQRLLEQLQNYSGTLICITHNLPFARALCERAVVFRQGRVDHDGPLRELIGHPPSLKKFGLDDSFRFAGAPPRPRLVATETRPPSSWAEPHKPLLAMTAYSYHYPQGDPVLQDLNFAFKGGERLAIVGENGAGKSTLAACLAGLRQGQGILTLNGRPIVRRSTELSRQVGLVFQEPADQLFCPSCREEVAFGLRQRRWPKAAIAPAVSQALDRVGLAGFEERVPLHLSHGERKRLALAAVLAMRPPILILDEPTAGLDAQGEKLLLELLADLDLTLLLISHDRHLIRRLTERTLVLHEGRIIRDYSTGDFFAEDLSENRGTKLKIRNAFASSSM